LQEMHAANLLHADVKSDNVVLNTADKWHLADYGACVEFGQPIASCTEIRSRSEPSLLHTFGVQCMHTSPTGLFC